MIDDDVKPQKIGVTPRVGIQENEPYKPWRFIWMDYPCVSRTQQNKIILKEIRLKKN